MKPLKSALWQSIEWNAFESFSDKVKPQTKLKVIQYFADERTRVMSNYIWVKLLYGDIQ